MAPVPGVAQRKLWTEVFGADMGWLPHRHRRIRVLGQVLRRQVGVAPDHLRRLPPAQLLDDVDRGTVHDGPGRLVFRCSLKHPILVDKRFFRPTHRPRPRTWFNPPIRAKMRFRATSCVDLRVSPTDSSASAAVATLGHTLGTDPFRDAAMGILSV